jgi:peptidoglycan/LPS O-acetylase OafA/YrhL
MKFRKDVNGLRAIAVIAVVLFHFNSSWMPGGFAGVDVFFVISGFLMTGIIFRGLEQQSFSILKFYVARANRIIPALAVLCIVLLVFGWFYLTPLDYKALGKHVASSLTFISNVTYWRESGYFDARSHDKWLLHTWSLSVEWQFYIIYPLVLVAMRRLMSIEAMKVTVLAGAVFGFIFCVIVTSIKPNPAFYLLPTRAWEMMVGGVAYLYPFALQEKRKKLVEWFGLFLIIGSYFLITKDHPWPGYLAIFPVLGAFLVIQSHRNDSFITTNIVSQKIGGWSYSIYLWHWPLVVFGIYFEIDNWIYIGIPLSLILGWLSYHIIEQYRFKALESLSQLPLVKPIWFCFFSGILGSVVFLTNGVESHYSEEVRYITAQSTKSPRWEACHSNWKWDSKPKECTYGQGDLAAIVIGDSHAQAMLGMIHRLYPNNKVLDWTMSACPTAEGVYREVPYTQGCGDFVSYAIKEAKEKYRGIPIIIINRTALSLYGFNETEIKRDQLKSFIKNKPKTPESLTESILLTACKFTDENPVFTVRPIPELKINVPDTLLKISLLNQELPIISISYDEYMKRQKLVYEMQDKMRDQCGVKIIDPIPYLCGADKCIGNNNDTIYYLDDDHLSENGADLIAPAFKNALDI